MRLHFGRSVAALTAFAGAVTLLAGCGGGSGIGNTSTGRMRVVDAAYLNGDTAQIVINSGSVDGNTSYFSSGSNSVRRPVPTCTSSPRTGFPSPTRYQNSSASTARPATTMSAQDQYYTAFLIGRQDTYDVHPRMTRASCK